MKPNDYFLYNSKMSLIRRNYKRCHNLGLTPLSHPSLGWTQGYQSIGIKLFKDIKAVQCEHGGPITTSPRSYISLVKDLLSRISKNKVTVENPLQEILDLILELCESLPQVVPNIPQDFDQD